MLHIKYVLCDFKMFMYLWETPFISKQSSVCVCVCVCVCVF